MVIAASALVLLSADAKILCVYFGDNAPNAATGMDCPHALLALPLDSLVGGCLFLPPAGAGDTAGAASATSALPLLG